MMRRMSLFAISVLVLSSTTTLRADEKDDLKHNPFSRPPSIVTVKARPVESADGSLQELDLRATLVAASNAFANVAGRILRPGDEVDDYTLLRVYEDRAVFTRDGRRTTVYVKPTAVDDNDLGKRR